MSEKVRFEIYRDECSEMKDNVWAELSAELEPYADAGTMEVDDDFIVFYGYRGSGYSCADILKDVLANFKKKYPKIEIVIGIFYEERKPDVVVALWLAQKE